MNSLIIYLRMLFDWSVYYWKHHKAKHFYVSTFFCNNEQSLREYKELSTKISRLIDSNYTGKDNQEQKGER